MPKIGNHFVIICSSVSENIQLLHGLLYVYIVCSAIVTHVANAYRYMLKQVWL